MVEGFIVEHGGGRSTKFLYEPEEFNGGADLEGGRVKMFADMYRKAEERLTELRFKKVYREREAFYLPE